LNRNERARKGIPDAFVRAPSACAGGSAIQLADPLRTAPLPARPDAWKLLFEGGRSQNIEKQPHAKMQAAGMDASKAG
jgi:hypothetical protein